MRRFLLCTAVLALAATSASPALAAPPVRIHAIFSGGAPAPWHVGQPLIVGLGGGSGSTPVTQVCWSPAPLGRAACSGKTNAPARSGTQTVTLTLADGTTRQRSFRVVASHRHYDGHVAATAHVQCVATTAFSNIFLRTDEHTFPLAMGTEVARYQTQGRGTAVWDYTAARVGFVKAACLAAGLG